MLVCVTLHTWNQVSNRFYMLLIVLLLFVLLHYSWRYSTWQYGFFIFPSAIQWGWAINRSLFFDERVFCWILERFESCPSKVTWYCCMHVSYAYRTQVLRLTSEPCPEVPRNAIGAGRTLSAPLGWLWRHPQSLRRRWTTQAGATWSERNLNHGTMRMYLLHGCVHDMCMELISTVKAICVPHKFHKIWRAERPKKTSKSDMCFKNQSIRLPMYGYLFTTKQLNNRYFCLPLRGSSAPLVLRDLWSLLSSYVFLPCYVLVVCCSFQAWFDPQHHPMCQ